MHLTSGFKQRVGAYLISSHVCSNYNSDKNVYGGKGTCKLESETFAVDPISRHETNTINLAMSFLP